MPKPAARNAWPLLAVLTLTYVISFVDRQFLAIAIEDVRAELALSDIQLGLLTGLAFAALYSILGLPMGALSDRISRTRMIAACTIVWSIATACCGLARTFPELFLARMFVGIGEAGLLPAAYSLIGDRFDRQSAPQAIGIFVAGSAVGNGLAVFGGGPLLDALSSAGGPSAWRQIFVFLGIAGVIISLAILGFRDTARPRKAGNDENGEGVPALMPFLGQMSGFLVPLIAAASLINVFFYGCTTWTPAFFMRTHSWDATQIGLTYGLCLLAFGLVAGPTWGRIGVELNKRHIDTIRFLVMTAILPLVIAVPAGSLSENPWISVAMLGLTPLFAGAFITLVPVKLVEMTPPALRGRVMAIFFLFVNLTGIGFGPLAYAWTTENIFGGPQYLGYSLTAVSLVLFGLSACLFLLSRRSLKRAINS